MNPCRSECFDFRSRVVNRADLLRCLHTLGETGLGIFAEQMGFVAPLEVSEATKKTLPEASKPEITTEPVEFPAQPGQPVTRAGFYRLIERRKLSSGERKRKTTLPDWFSDEQTPPLDLGSVQADPVAAPTHEPLAPWSRLWPVLKQVLSQHKRARQVDIDQLVKQLSKAEILHDLPRQSRHSWAVSVQILVDYEARLLPFHEDFTQLVAQLKLLRGWVGLDIHVLDGPPCRLIANAQSSHDVAVNWQPPQPGVPVLILSDLGVYESQGSDQSDWHHFLNYLSAIGCDVIALMPVPQRYISAQIPESVRCITWDRQLRFSPAIRMRKDTARQASMLQADQAVAKQLLTLLALAIRVEPSLLRAARYLLPANQADVASEAMAWLHEDVVPSTIGFHFRQAVIAAYITDFSAQSMSIDMQTTMFRLIRDYHRHYFPTLRYEEIDHFCQYTQVAVGELGEEAALHLRGLCKALIQQPEHSGLPHWAQGYLQRQTFERRRNNRVVAAIWASLRKRMDADGEGYWDLPNGLVSEWVEPFLDQDHIARQVTLYQQGQSLTLAPQPAASSNFSRGLSELVTLEVTQPTIRNRSVGDESGQVERWLDLTTDVSTIPLLAQDKQVLETDRECLTIERLTRPEWAARIGRDQRGLFAICRHAEADRYDWYPPDLDGDDASLPGFWYSASSPRLPEKPSWASAIGRDQYGLFVNFTYKKRFTKSITQRLRWINPGIFLMGSPEDEPERGENESQHPVTLTQGYWLADTVCTQALWKMVMGGNPSQSEQGDLYPVETVSWDDIQTFIQRLNDKIPGLAIRLPTEAEWEYACRAGTRTPFSLGGNITPEQVNYNGNYPYAGGKKGEYREKTVEVTALPENNWGLYQMHGNVWEWCADWYGEYPNESVTDPVGPTAGDDRVLRGGSWIDDARHARSAFRYSFDPFDRSIFVRGGFRLARGPKEQKPARE